MHLKWLTCKIIMHSGILAGHHDRMKNAFRGLVRSRRPFFRLVPELVVMLRLAAAGLVRNSSCVSAQWHWSFALCSSSSASQGAPPIVRQQACRRFRPVQQPYAPEWDLTEGKEEEIEKRKRDWNSKDKMSMWPYRWHDKYGMTPEKWEYYNKVVWPPNYVVPETGKPKAPVFFAIDFRCNVSSTLLHSRSIAPYPQ
jgi:hypothetical protein